MAFSILFRKLTVAASAATVAASLAGCAGEAGGTGGNGGSPVPCPPPVTSVDKTNKPAFVVATPADTPATRRAVEAASQHDGVVLLVKTAEWPAPPTVLLAADVAGKGPNDAYIQASAARARRCFEEQAAEVVKSLGTTGHGDALGQIQTLIGMGISAGNGNTKLIEVGFARHVASGVDLVNADLSTPELRQRLVREHLNAGVLRPLPAGTEVVFLSPGEGAINSVEAGFLTALATLVCDVLAPDPKAASCSQSEVAP